jgi:F420-non-reducing hydrogenase iron-sulfur subunit
MKDMNSKIYLFYCNNNLHAAELVRSCGKGADEMKVIALPCSGKIDILYLTKAFETGADGVAVLTCPQGECHYLEGNLRARKRMESIDSLLDEIGLGKGRTIVIQLGDGKIQQAISELDNFRARVKVLAGLQPKVVVKTG